MTEDRKRNRAMKFTKMQGIGNDYVYINCFEEQVESPERLAVKISDRHFGVGSDGLILICPSDAADCRMKMFNADASEGAMCGNAIRCVGKYVYDHKIVDKKIITVETKGGIKTLDMTVENGKVTLVRVDMGEPVLTSGLPENINILGEDYQFVGISVGNSHAVYFMEEIDSLDLEKIGPAFENHKRFPDRVNTEFVRFIDGEHIQMRVWERGSGETWACGTGATASAVASILTGRTGNQVDFRVDVALRGGHLLIEWNRETNHVFMTGPAVEVFTGDYEPV